MPEKDKSKLITALESMIEQVEYLAPESFDDAEHERNFYAQINEAREVLDAEKGKKP